MIDLSLQGVRWSVEHGHPVVMLRAGDDAASHVAIVLSTGDAQLLALNPPSASQERRRLFELVERATNMFGAKLVEVHLRLDARMVLTADLHYLIGERTHALPAAFADALVLARRTGAPLLMSERDLQWILATRTQTGTPDDPAAADTALGQSVAAFIESLQIDDLSGPPRRAD